jgi:1,6-anhydro-N-acetylmuramate kinase
MAQDLRGVDDRPTGGLMTRVIAWDRVGAADVERALAEYDRLGAKSFFAEHGFAPTTTYQLVWKGGSYPPKAILGTAYKFATGERLVSPDFEGGRAGAVKVLEGLGFSIERID